MKISFIGICFLLAAATAAGQEHEAAAAPQIMTLGVFHFAFPNLDVVQTKEEDKINVLDEPWQSEIIAIARAIEKYDPTIIAVELPPRLQDTIDYLFSQYKAGRWELKPGEDYQLGFRIANNLGLQKIYCIDDPGRHYQNLLDIFNDTERVARFEKYYMDNFYSHRAARKVTSIKEALLEANQPELHKESLASYLSHPFKYEEQEGDFTGVDFETGRWFNRNLRIMRNIQRIPQGPDDRILLIIGRDHLNLLNYFFEVSHEYNFISVLPYLETAGD